MSRPVAVPVPDRALVLSKAVSEVAKHLSISSSELATILGVSQSSASRLMRGEYSVRDQSKEWEMAALLVRLYRGLYSIVGNNDQLARDWLNSPNLAFGNQTPFIIIQQASGLVHACDYIDAHRAPA